MADGAFFIFWSPSILLCVANYSNWISVKPKFQASTSAWIETDTVALPPITAMLLSLNLTKVRSQKKINSSRTLNVNILGCNYAFIQIPYFCPEQYINLIQISKILQIVQRVYCAFQLSWVCIKNRGYCLNHFVFSWRHVVNGRKPLQRHEYEIELPWPLLIWIDSLSFQPAESLPAEMACTFQLSFFSCFFSLVIQRTAIAQFRHINCCKFSISLNRSPW